MNDIVKIHKNTRHLTETLITPEHKIRKTSPTFSKSKNKLKEDGHYKCWVCGAADNLQVHHFLCEWSLENVCDLEKLKKLSEIFDIYGYGKKLVDIPVTSVDDIRNMMVLCKDHHIGGITDGVANGIHNLSFSAFIIQKICQDGKNPVPNNKKELEKIMRNIQ